MEVLLVILAILVVAFLASRFFSNRTLDIVLMVGCAVSAVALAADDPHGFDYAKAVLLAILAIWLAWKTKRERDSTTRSGTARRSIPTGARSSA